MSVRHFAIYLFVFLCAATAMSAPLRFVSAPNVCAVRVQLYSPAGDLIADSDWQDGNLVDLPMPGSDGAYRYAISVKNVEGEVTSKQATLMVRDGEAVDTAGVKLTTFVNDGKDGAIVNTSGDLSFRFGDFIAGKDVEKMRLRSDGTLEVQGLIRANGGIALPDGTVVTGIGGAPQLPATQPAAAAVPAMRVAAPAANPSPSSIRSPMPPRTSSGPVPQFVVDQSGVHVGETVTFPLFVTGDTSTSTLSLPATAGTTSGVINLNGESLLHAYGAQNVFLGASAGNFNMSGAANTGIGYHSLSSETSGIENTALGSEALERNLSGSDNTAIGIDALAYNDAANENTAIGAFALHYNVGSRNTALGALALNYLGTGSDNTAVGAYAMNSAGVTATSNTATGTEALYNTNGQANTADGHHALHANIAGVHNTAVGFGALASSTGSHNIAIGSGAGGNLTAGDFNIDVASAGVAGDSNTIRIGNGQTKTFIDGITGSVVQPDAVPVVIDSAGQLGTVSSSRRFKFDIQDAGDSTSRLMQLRPVTFRYLAHGPDAPLQYGLIAEEVADVYPELVARDKDGQPETVMYQFLAPMLLNELQKEHRKNEEQAQTIEELREEMHALARRLQALESERANR